MSDALLNCETCREYLDDYRRDVLREDVRAGVSEHLAACEECAAELQADEQLGSLLKSLAAGTRETRAESVDFKQLSAAARLRIDAPAVHWSAWSTHTWGIAAALLLALGTGAMLYVQRSPQATIKNRRIATVVAPPAEGFKQARVDRVSESLSTDAGKAVEMQLPESPAMPVPAPALVESEDLSAVRLKRTRDEAPAPAAAAPRAAAELRDDAVQSGLAETAGAGATTVEKDQATTPDSKAGAVPEKAQTLQFFETRAASATPQSDVRFHASPREPTFRASAPQATWSMQNPPPSDALAKPAASDAPAQQARKKVESAVAGTTQLKEDELKVVAAADAVLAKQPATRALAPAATFAMDKEVPASSAAPPRVPKAVMAQAPAAAQAQGRTAGTAGIRNSGNEGAERDRMRGDTTAAIRLYRAKASLPASNVAAEAQLRLAELLFEDPAQRAAAGTAYRRCLSPELARYYSEETLHDIRVKLEGLDRERVDPTQ
ncbi:MAG: hypothetical protein ACR2IE_17665 [Candidatus Sumerlaeaceae bacterium]